jgi:hypothetical protein
VKALLKKAATRTRESLIEAIRDALGGSAEDAQGSILKSLVVPSTTTEQQLVENLLRGIEK